MADDKVDLNPKLMDGYIKNGLHVLGKADKVPKGFFKACAGILLISSHESGLFFTSQKGAGVALLHKGGEWSAPIAVTMDSLGWGAGIGVADKDMLIFLDPLCMKRLLEGNFQAKLGVDIGFAAGPVGGVGSMDIGLSDKLGGGTSIGYTWAKGVMLNVEVQSGAVGPDPNANKFFYKTSNTTDILEGKAKVLKESEAIVNPLWDKLKEYESK